SLDNNYYYKVKAYKEIDGQIIYSDFSDVKGTAFPPTTPAFSIEKVGNGVRLSWKKLAGQEGYEVWRGDGSSSDSKVIADIDTIDYTDKQITMMDTSGVEFYYSVRAYRTVDGVKVYSNLSEFQKMTINDEMEVEVVDEQKLGTIRKPTIYAYGFVDYGESPYAPPTPSKIQIIVNQIPGVDGYEIYVSDSKEGTYNLVGETISDRYDDERVSWFSLDNNYYYKARAYKLVDGDREYSEFSDIVGAAFPPTTPSFALEKVGNGEKLYWKKLAGQERYEVWRGEGSTRATEIIADVDSIEYTDKEITMMDTTDKEFYYGVRAYRVVDGVKIYSNFYFEMIKFE
ncbi:MAG: hypothetical protein PHV68_09695, partial [Candidatus Gastranaerophilales bacterium]|nr:hypothetical protein [Candidatus Gastranaerophilales bacterium]